MEKFLEKCGGCGNGSKSTNLQIVLDKKSNKGYLCPACIEEYSSLLQPGSIRNFWMCGKCEFRVLASTAIDMKVDEIGGKCPHCGVILTNALVINLNQNMPIKSGIISEPLE